jgi:hypothetical protein
MNFTIGLVASLSLYPSNHSFTSFIREWSSDTIHLSSLFDFEYPGSSRTTEFSQLGIEKCASSTERLFIILLSTLKVPL